MSDSESNNDAAVRFSTGALEVRIVHCGQACTVLLRADQFKTLSCGRRFIHLQPRSASVRRLLCAFVKRAGRSHEHTMKTTDIINQLMSLKNRKVREMILAGHSGTPTRYRPTLKKYAKNRCTIAEFVTITASTIGSVEGIAMNVLSTPCGGRGCGLFVEALSDNFKYLAMAVAEQDRAGGVVKDRPNQFRTLATAERSTNGEDEPDATETDSSNEAQEEQELAGGSSDDNAAGKADAFEVRSIATDVHDDGVASPTKKMSVLSMLQLKR